MIKKKKRYAVYDHIRQWKTANPHIRGAETKECLAWKTTQQLIDYKNSNNI